jgi:hypothetical protein
VLPLHHRAVDGTSDACGIRTQPDQCERLVTSPEVERAEKNDHEGHEKSPVLVTPGFRKFFEDDRESPARERITVQIGDCFADPFRIVPFVRDVQSN